MLDPTHPLAELLRRDARYKFEAYVFVFDALRYGQEKLGLGDPIDRDVADSVAGDFGDEPIDEDDLEGAADEFEVDLGVDGFGSDAEEFDNDADDDAERHVTGQELCHAIQQYAVDQYGLMARAVLSHWGVTSTGDFGEIVFNLIRIGQMRKTDADRREDFDGVYEFDDAFGKQVVFSQQHCAIESEDDLGL